MRPALAAASAIGARSVVPAREPVSPVAATGGSGAGTGTGAGAGVTSLAAGELGVSGASMMIGEDGAETVTPAVDAAAEAAAACSTAAASRRPENCQAASAATTTNAPPPATTSQDFEPPRRPAPVAAEAASGAGRDAGGKVTGGRLFGPDGPGGSVAGRDAAQDAGCEAAPSRPWSGAGRDDAPSPR